MAVHRLEHPASSDLAGGSAPLESTAAGAMHIGLKQDELTSTSSTNVFSRISQKMGHSNSGAVKGSGLQLKAVSLLPNISAPEG